VAVIVPQTDTPDGRPPAPGVDLRRPLQGIPERIPIVGR